MTSTPISELQGINPSAIIELFVLELNVAQHGVSSTYRFHAGVNELNNGDIVWDGDTYSRLPIEADGFEYSGSGQIPRPKLRVANLLGTITTLLASLPNGLSGAKVTRLRTMARYLDAANFTGGTNPYGTPDPTALLPTEIYFVDQKTAETRDVIEFELAAVFDLQGVRAPKRQTIRNVCQWKYRNYNSDTSSFEYDQVDCPYTGNIYFKADDTITTDPALDQCGKRLSSCQKRFGAVDFTGDVTKGSTTLNVDSGQADELALIDTAATPEIKGFGIASGTTVTAKTATTLTLSQAAEGTTTVGDGSASEEGTITSTGLSIKMVNNPVTQGIQPGMTVTGAMVPSGTRVKKVVGGSKLVYLNIDNNVEVLSLVYPDSYVEAGYIEQDYFYDYVEGVYTASTNSITISDTSAVSNGDFVIGPDIYANTKVKSQVTNTSIKLSKAQAIEDGATIAFAIYEKATRAADYYVFSGPDTYAIKPQAGLPFGSFPGVGQFR